MHNVPLGDRRLDLRYRRKGQRLLVEARSMKPEVLCLLPQNEPFDTPCTDQPRRVHRLEVPLPPVEIAIPHGLPPQGSRATGLKVIEEHISSDYANLEFEAPGGASYELPVRLNRRITRIQGAELRGDKLRIRIPAGAGFQHTVVTLQW